MARKILLADDSVTAQNMGRKILADAGYEVIAVNNGSAALKKINEIRPDLVVLDVYMPGYSGLEVCQRLKESPETDRIPVLLTVGKLEPFKPEEAKRVRAEAFIVKPFEASELLSALSKLEDKVVPRSEPSRPGRFARAFAAVEESDRVRSGEDNSWKDRISFPLKKSESEGTDAKEETVDDDSSATRKPVNRDPLPVGEMPVEKAQEAAEEKNIASPGRAAETVDVASLAPLGVPSSSLPKDVTQEEVTAIAAAAAQIQMANAAFEQAKEDQGREEQKSAEGTSAAAPESAPDTVGFEPPMREIAVDTSSPARSDTTTASTSRAAEAENSNESEAKDVPVTMAATADSAAAASGAPRWTAVAVALENEESGISLEQEMQKAYAASQASAESAPVSEAPSETLPKSASAPDSAEVNQVPIETPAQTPHPEPAVSASVGELAASPVAQVDAPPTAALSLVTEPSADSPAPTGLTTQLAETSETIPSTPEGRSFEAASDAQTEQDAQTKQEVAASGEFPSGDFSFRQFARPEPPAPFAEDSTGAAHSDVRQEPEPAQAGQTVESSSGYRNLHSGEQTAEAQPETGHDNERVKNSAAAWATWRQIRDNNKATEQELAKNLDTAEPETTQPNAAAVAAGAEQALRAANADADSNPSDVASIVDSVLADLRPKLMKEISRKIAEKK